MHRSSRGNEAEGKLAADRVTRRQILRQTAAVGLMVPAVAAVTGAQTGASPGAVARAQADASTLTYASYGSPIDLDPHSAVEDRSALVIRGVYEQLIALKGDQTDEYEGLIAERWESNADNSVWTFHLRPGVTFHDGSPCDAEAVRLSFERLLTLGLAPVSVISRFFDDPAQVSAPDPQTVVFDLGRPQPLFEAAISAQYGAQIVNAALLREHEENGDWGHAWAELNTEGLGTGPYRVTQFEPAQLVELERVDGYWRGWDGEHFDSIFVRVVIEAETRRQLIERGEVDITDSVTPASADALRQTADVVVDPRYSTEVDYVILTVAGPLASPEARRAMCYTFPYDDVLAGAMLGYGKRAIGPVAEACRGFAPDTFTYSTDLDMAKELLSQAGVAEGTALSLMMTTGSPSLAAIAQLFQANLQQIGIELTIETVDFNAFAAVLFRDVTPDEQPNLMPWSWWPSYNDAWDHLQAQVMCDQAGSAGTNAGYYCNPRVDELMNEARDAADLAVYGEVMAEIQQIVSRDDPPAIYYLQPQWITALRSDVAGFVFNPIYIGAFGLYRLHRVA